MKKTVLSLAVVVILAIILSSVAFARGGYGAGVHCGGRGNAIVTNTNGANTGNTNTNRTNTGVVSRYALCTTEGCEVYGPHEHDGAWYCNQIGINWDNYEVCAVEGCAALGFHEHDGAWSHCANYPNGGGYFGGCGRNRR